MLRVCLLHMGNTAPSGIVPCTGWLKLSVCEWALVCTGPLPMVILAPALSQCHILEIFGGTSLRTVPSPSLSCFLSLSLALTLSPLSCVLLNFSLFQFFLCLVNLRIPKQLVIIQLGDVITEHATALPRDDGCQAPAFDCRL